MSPSAACLLRSNALSLVYLLFLLLLPWFPGPSRHSLRGKGQAELPPGGGGAGLRALCPGTQREGGAGSSSETLGSKGFLWFHSCG